MPQPITKSTSTRRKTSEPPVPRPLTPRQLREERWRQLTTLHGLFTSLMVERTLHGFAEDADVVARQIVHVEDDLERIFPVRWARHRAGLLRTEASWWGEEHAEDVLACTTCRVLTGPPQERIDLPTPRKVWG